MWILYYDKVPNYRFGTIKQQLWMALHLPFHLGILGVVEGSQQLAQARYIYYNTGILFQKLLDGCVEGQLNGEALAKNLTKTVDYFKFNESARGTLALDYVWPQVYFLGNETNVCSAANTTNLDNGTYGLPYTFSEFLIRTISAMYQSFEIDIEKEGDAIEESGFFVAVDSWAVVYTYFWAAIILLEVCYLVTALLAETSDGSGHWRSWGRYTTPIILSRGSMIALAVVLLVLGRAIVTNGQFVFMQSYIRSAWILPTVVLKLWFICVNDRMNKMWGQRRKKKQAYKRVSATMPSDRPIERPDAELKRKGTNGYGYPSH